MADDTMPADTVVVRRPLWQRILKWIGIAIAVLVLLVLAIAFGINTDPGRRFIADQIGGYTTASGLNIKVGRIDGSIYSRMRLSDLRVSDQRGVFLTSPRLDLDWRPLDYINNHVDVRSVTSPLITMRRNPELKETPPTPEDENAPLLPDLDIDIGRLAVERFVMEAPVAGRRYIGAIDGQAHIAERRAQLLVDARTLRAAGVPGGDVARLKLDAVPDDNKLDVEARVAAPVGGVVAALGGLKAPMNATLGGRGSWKEWRGQLAATLGNGELANLTVLAQDGRIRVNGITRPGLYLEGPVERLTAPGLRIESDTRLADRKADTRIKLTSDALAVDAGGLIDLANSRLGNFAVDAMLRTPGAIAPNLRGRDVLARVVLNGAFATPTVDYKLRAATLGFAETTVENVYAEGLARVNADRILVPVHARARRITGLNPAIGGLANNARIDGDLAIAMPNILSDNLRIRSDNIDATAIIAANMETGRYTGGLQGRVNGYRVDSVGIFNVNTQADLVPAPNGGFGITGRVALQSTRWLNDGIRNFLGGNVTASTRFGYSPEGIATFQTLRVNSPQFRVTRGQGRYDPNGGGLLVDADAFSTQYGPLYARVTGSVASPVVRLRAPRPGVGIGLANLDARVVGRDGAYQVNATGGTNYGPFTADVLVRPAAQLTVDIRRVLFAGVNFAGRVAQTAAGPFAGAVRFAGSGLTGNVQLGARGKYQRALVDARAYAATIPGQADFTIGRAIVNADVTLYDKPQVLADAQVADLRYGATVIQSARARVDYRNGAGTAQALATGSNGVPFRVALNSRLSPELYLVALQGQANGIGFRTPAPARVVPAGGGYRLEPTRLNFDKGTMRLAGRFGGAETVAQARLDRLDLSILSAFAPNIGVGGTATGSLDFIQRGSAFPQADARLNISNFTRTSLAAVSEPVDVVFQGRLASSAGEARALIRRGATTVGRMVATLTPQGSGGWSTRLMQGPLLGGIRYNGPAGVLFSFAGLAEQQLSGGIAIAADFGGTVQAPRFNGLIRADDLTYDNETYGTRLSQMRIAARFNNDRLELTQLSARAGDGSVQARGSVGIAAASGFPIDLTATLDNARLARSDSIAATASGTVRVQNGPQGGLISGTINIPEARYEIIRQGAAEVPELTGVRKKSEVRAAQLAAQGRPTDRPAAPSMGLFKLDLRVRAENQLYVSGMGLESEWEADMRIGGTSSAPVITGGLDVVRGTFSFAGNRFEVSRGQVRFRGGALTDPDINILATTTKDSITFNIAVTGTGQRPQIAFTSTPALPQDEVLSRLLFGASPENLSATEAIQLAAALNSLRGSGGGLNPLGKLRSATGFDRLRVLGGDEASGRGTSLAAGKYLTDDIYIEIVTDARGFTATQLTIALTKALSVLSQAGSFGGSNVQLRYSKDY